jgi:hypothetical protein
MQTSMCTCVSACIHGCMHSYMLVYMYPVCCFALVCMCAPWVYVRTLCVFLHVHIHIQHLCIYLYSSMCTYIYSTCVYICIPPCAHTHTALAYRFDLHRHNSFETCVVCCASQNVRESFPVHRVVFFSYSLCTHLVHAYSQLTCIYIYIYTYTYIHTYIHTHTQT